jgi:hypothetical protein
MSGKTNVLMENEEDCQGRCCGFMPAINERGSDVADSDLGPLPISQ